MPARLAFPLFYERCVSGLGDDARLEVDAMLGDVEAIAELDERRREAIDLAGIEVG